MEYRFVYLCCQTYICIPMHVYNFFWRKRVEMSKEKIAVIGAGPVGLEAALYALQLGYEVHVFEQGEVGANIRRWGHVSLFSPWEMNHTPLGVRLLKEIHPGWKEPSADAIQTGVEYVRTYLQPLAQLPQLRDSLHTNIRVVSIGRSRIMKGDLIGDLKRTDDPFKLLTRDHEGREKFYSADIVIDASGVYHNPNWLGGGGIPALGEEASQPHIDYHLCDLYGKDRARFAAKKTLLIGAGYSAATTVSDFRNLIREEPDTSLIWVVRDDRQAPIPVIEDDPLSNREKLTGQANSVATGNISGIEYRSNTTVAAVAYDARNNHFTVQLDGNDQTEEIIVDRVIANVGYGPDNFLYRELQVHECYASRGPMKLSAALLGASGSTDCLTQGSMGADTLRNPEPNFYLIGNKSYGRNPTFLMRIGFSQIVEVFSLIAGNEKLNLYESKERAAAQ